MNYVEIINRIVEALLASNVAIPIIFETIGGIVALIRAASGSGPDAAEWADIIEKKVKERNEPALLAEIARLRAKLAGGI